MNVHPFRNRHGARSNKGTGTCLFNHAYTTVACHTQIRVIAESRYVNAQFLGSIKDRGSCRYLNFLIIYL